MNYKNIFLTVGCVLMTIFMSTSCDDNTSTLGMDMMPSNDMITKNYETYDVETRSFAVGDSVLARTSTSYLGRFTDPETNTTIKSDYMCQFNCIEAFSFPDSINGDTTIFTELDLFVPEFVGDSLTSFKINIYELDSILDPNQDYYTNIDPTKYVDITKQPIATKWYTLSDRTLTDSERKSSDYDNHISISLPKYIGDSIYNAYRRDPEIFTNTSTWIHSGLPCSKGVYIKLESGDGAMAYIDVGQLNIVFNYYDEGYEKDTIGVCEFAATEEVVQASRFENKNLDVLLSDTGSTYLKSPAGIFTMATLPVDKINVNDTINSATIAFTRYNDKVDSGFKLEIPNKILMVRYDDYINGFFEAYKVSNNKTSYITTFNSKKNTYEFSNIARLIQQMLTERREGTASANYDKVLLIPITTTSDSQGNVVMINHDFSMSSARLVGGETDRVEMKVIYTSFNGK